MHNTVILLLVVCQTSISAAQSDFVKKSDLSVNKTQPNQPDVGPSDIPPVGGPRTQMRSVSQETKFKPAMQEKPPSSTFIPPKSSGGNSFNPQGQFVSPSKSDTQRPEAKSSLSDDKPGSGFSLVDPQATKPLRSDQNAEFKGNNSSIGDSSPKFTIGSQNSSPSNPSSAQTPKSDFSLQDDPKTGSPSSPYIRPSTATTPSTNPQIPRAQFSQGSQSVRDSVVPGNTPSSPRVEIQQGQLRQTPSQSAPAASSYATPESSQTEPQPTIESRQVDDATFDPQLKEITDLILTSVRRPNFNRLSLAKAVGVARDAAHRKQIVKQYWTCFVTSADMQFAQQELQLLGTVSRPNSRLEQLLLRAATSSAAARLAETKLAYEKAATELYKLAPVFDDSESISFADLPWVGKYKTNTDGFVKTGMFNDKIRQVDTALPALRDLIYMRGAAVYDNLSALQQSIEGVSNGLVKLDSVLRLHEETRDQRIEFLKNVQKYNHAIADYAISVFPNAGNPEVVANMLVDTQMTLPGETIMDRNVRQASGTRPDLR